MSVVGVFNNLREAQAAVRDLKAAGFRDDEIGILGPGDHDTKHAGTGSTDGGTHASEGAIAGAATGAGVGALWAIGIAAGFLPAIGPVIAGGIFASILASAAGAAAAGGLAGALIGMGIPEEEASYYENEFKGGRTIVTVKTTTRQDEARNILSRHSGFDMQSRPDRAGTSTAARSTTSDASTRAGIAGANAMSGSACATNPGATARTDVANQKVQLREEQLQAEKQTKRAGEVRVHKDVVTEHKTIDVPVTREEVVIERHAAHGTRAAGDISTDQEIRIPVKEEEVRVTKTPVVKEEVSVGKRSVTENKHVEADVRHEELRVDETGDARVTDKTTGRTRKSR
jgi:uncharacterized protein (TIGR02271 family)